MREQPATKLPQIRFKGFEEEWETKRVDAIAPLQRGFDLPTTKTKPGRYPVVYSNGILRSHCDYKCEAPGVVTGRSGTIGKVNFVSVNYWPHNTSLWVTNFFKNDPRFIHYFYVNLRLERFNAGSTIPTLNRNDVHAISASVPTPSEQTQIGGYFRTLDGLIGLHQRKHDKLVTLKKAMLRKMFPLPGATTPEIRCKGFSGDWVEKEFKHVASRSTQTNSEEHLPRIEYEDIISGTGRLNKDLFKKSSRKVGVSFEKGDVLFGKLRPYLKNWWLAEFGGIAVGDFWVLKAAAATSNLIYCLIQTEDFERVANQSAGSKMPRSDWKLVANSVFRIPKNIEEQQKIGTYFSALEELVNQHAIQLQKLQQIKLACLERMFV